jgi:hypothetical protein
MTFLCNNHVLKVIIGGDLVKQAIKRAKHEKVTIPSNKSLGPMILTAVHVISITLCSHMSIVFCQPCLYSTQINDKRSTINRSLLFHVEKLIVTHVERLL